MSILITKNTKVLVQGITGNEGEKAAKAMLEYGTDVIGGVRPGKGGEEVLGKPVFNTVAESVSFFMSGGTGRDLSVQDLVSTIYVPPFAAKAAILEAIETNKDLSEFDASNVTRVQHLIEISEHKRHMPPVCTF